MTSKPEIPGHPENTGHPKTSGRPGSERPRENLASILTGTWRTSIDATVPPIAFLTVWLLTDHAVLPAVTAALVVALATATVRLVRRTRPVGVLIGLLLVIGAAILVLITGRAVDFFLPRLLANVASALLFAISIAARWPLLGVLVSGVLGQGTRWRRDPDLLRAYTLASWPWVAIYTLRTLVFGGLYLTEATTALGIAQITLTWPLVIAALATSTWTIHHTLPPHHPGIRHPTIETTRP